MPVLSRRPHVLAPRPGGSARNSTDSNEGMKQQLWIVGEEYEKPQKEMDFPSAKLGKMPSRSKSRNALRINTYTKQDLHDRYLSSEEEPSPSPDDDGHSYEEELEQSAAEIFADDALDACVEDFKAEIAIAMPILAYGRPKLVDITNLAPMHKRKRPAKPLVPHSVAKSDNGGTIRASATAATPVSPAAAPPTVVDENHPPSAHNATDEPIIPASNLRQQLKRKERFSMSAPESWLPEDPPVEDEDERDSFPNLNFRSTAAYRHEYDPFAFGLDTPRRISNRSLHHFSTRVIEDDDYSPSSPLQPTPVTPTSNSGWKGLTRTLSLAKRNSGSHQPRPVNKKPKMIPRGANEREDSPIIPPFPFEDEVAVAS